LDSHTQQLRDALTILRLSQVRQRTGLGRSTVYDKVKAGEFPAPVALGNRAVGWIEAEVSDWIAGRIAASRKAQA
jgi:prophage regulatory protein